MDNQFYDYMNDTSCMGYLLCGLITVMKMYKSPVWGGDYMNDILVAFTPVWVDYM